MLESTGLRSGTQILCPTPTLPVNGEGAFLPPVHGGTEGGHSVAIETLLPGDVVFGDQGKPSTIQYIDHKPFYGMMIGIQHKHCSRTLWITPNYKILCKPRPRTLGGQRDWSGTQKEITLRAREMRKAPTPPEQRLWQAIRDNQIGIKFRRQHPIGNYITDFYSREAHLVIEVDGKEHFTPQGIAYDLERNATLYALGLNVLHFTAAEVINNLEGVLLVIQNQIRRNLQEPLEASWLPANSLLPGDLVYFGYSLSAVQIKHIVQENVKTEIFHLEIGGSRSFITEVCAVYDYIL